MAYNGDEGITSDVKSADVLFTTPEKLDILSRKWKSHRDVFARFGLLLIDEVHLLSEERRGATLEIVVSRLRFIKAQVGAKSLRLGAVSATVPNLDKIAAWLGAPETSVLSFGEEFRAVPLEVVVHGFGYPGCNSSSNAFFLERDLDAALPSIIKKYSEGKPALVFCSSRKNAQSTAETLASHALQLSHPRTYVDSFGGHPLLPHQRTENVVEASVQAERARIASAGIQGDDALRNCIIKGACAWHSAAVSPYNLRCVEELFRKGLLGM